MNEIIKICGVALIGLAATAVMRGLRSDFAWIAGVTTGILLLGFAVWSMHPVIEYIEKIS